MLQMLQCEILKIKRNAIILIGLVAVLISAFYSIFQMFLGIRVGEAVNYELLNYVLVFNNTTLVFPAAFALFGGYLINREYDSDTLKSLLSIPVSLRKLFVVKLVITGLFSVLFGLVSFTIVLLAAHFLLHFNIAWEQAFLSLRQVCGMAFFNFLAVTPIIVLFTRKRGHYLIGAGLSFLMGLISLFVGKTSITNIFPITAGYKLVDYAAAYETATPLVSLAVYVGVLIVLIICIYYLPAYDELMSVNSPVKKNAGHCMKE